MTPTWALDAREAFRPSPRGIGLYQRHLMREFAHLAPREGLLLYHQRPLPETLPAMGDTARPKRIDIPGDRWFLWELLRLPLALWRDRPTVYHGTCNTLPPFLPCPAVVTLHDVIVLWWNEDPPDSYVRHCRRVTRRTVRSARVVLTVSEYSRQQILERFRVPEERVKVFYNGIQPTLLEDAPADEVAEARARLDLEAPYLFAIGSHLRRKNTAGLLRAAGELARHGRLEHRLAISGIGPEQRPPLQELAAQLGLADRLTFLPYLDEKDLRSVYTGADLFVYPSRAEGWGIPVLEAMAAGTPVACSEVTSIPEAGGEHALYFDPESPAAMADVIHHALRDPGRWEGVREAARARARSYRWDQAAAVTLEAYREAAGG